MSDRVQLGWRVPEDVWERFEEHVYEVHGRKGPYVRFELESAMREFLDEDEVLAEAEQLLKEHTELRGLSSSTQTAVGTGRYRGKETKKIGRRINPEVKERFQIFADKHDASSYGRALASALDSYADGGRARRILEDVKRLVTGGTSSGTTDDSVENPVSTDPDAGTSPGTTAEPEESPLSTAADGGTSSGTSTGEVEVTAEHVLEIVEQLPDGTIPKYALDEAIVDVVGVGGDDVKEAYREAVLEQVPAGEHPHNDDVFISESFREDATFWADLDKAQRIVLLRRFAAMDAVDHDSRRRKYGYRDVMDLFEEYASAGPSHQYAYDLMEAAADEPGFEYGKYHGQKQLRVDLDEVSSDILDWALDEYPSKSREDLATDGLITSYAAGPTPNQDVATTDD